MTFRKCPLEVKLYLDIPSKLSSPPQIRPAALMPRFCNVLLLGARKCTRGRSVSGRLLLANLEVMSSIPSREVQVHRPLFPAGATYTPREKMRRALGLVV